MMLMIWCGTAALVLAASVGVHLATFFGVDPMAAIPSVMNIHFIVLATFVVAITYTTIASRDSARRQDNVIKRLPRWLKIMMGVLLIYYLANGLFLTLDERGQPHEMDGKYLLMDHGKMIRQLSEEEFHQKQAHLVREFSLFWMFLAVWR